jgi:large subunit ribosomal protein L10
MSKTVKQLIMRDYKSRFGDASDAMLISIRGVSAVDTTKVRNELRKKNIQITVVRNSLARKSIEGTSLEPLAPLLKGASALAYGGNSVVEVARELIKIIETIPAIELKGAVLDGTLYEGKEGVTELSKFPTREEALAQTVTLIVSPGRKLMAQITGPGATIAGIIKAIEEKLEKGETIAKAG